MRHRHSHHAQALCPPSRPRRNPPFYFFFCWGGSAHQRMFVGGAGCGQIPHVHNLIGKRVPRPPTPAPPPPLPRPQLHTCCTTLGKRLGSRGWGFLGARVSGFWDMGLGFRLQVSGFGVQNCTPVVNIVEARGTQVFLHGTRAKKWVINLEI